jgi:ABC-type polysaccharide/polyol phosphate export permease
MLHNLAALFRYRGLIQSLVARELKARYRGSVLGFFWSFFNPLLLLLVYSFVFAYIMPARFIGGETPTAFADAYPYALFLFCGLLPWTSFASSLNESSGVLISGGNLIKKVLFPAEVLPIVTALANLVHFFFGLPILALFLAYYDAPLRISELLWFPVIVLVQLVLTMALGLLVSALTVHFRDIRDILSNVLTLWFFATPIIYPWQHAPDLGKWFLNANPFTHLAISYQEVLFFEGPFGHWRWLLALGVASAVFFLFAYFIFDRLRDTFAEEV